MKLERRELSHPDERRAVVADAVVDLALVAPAPDRRRLDPVGAVLRAALLVEVLLRDAVGVALQRHRAAAEVRQDRVGDPRVVVDHLALGEANLGPEHLVEIRQLELVPVDVYLAALALLRDRDLDWEDFEREDDFFAVERLLFLAAPSPSLPASGSPRTAARLSSRAAIRSGALVGLGSSETGSTTDLPCALRSIRDEKLLAVLVVVLARDRSPR